MAEILEKSGLYLDELNKLRILDPQYANKTNELKEECKVFVEKIDEFQKLTDNFMIILSNLSAQVEKQKIRAVGKRNLLQSMNKHKEVLQQQLQALIQETTMELERLKIHQNSLQKTEIEQQEIIEKLTRY